MNKFKFWEAMDKAGYSQRGLAKALGVDKNTVNSWVNGKTPLRISRIVDICRLLDISDSSVIVDIFLPELSQK